MAFHKATRQQAKLRLALAGLAGYGKTYSTILIAAIIAELMRLQLGRRGKIAVIDTEHESASLYAMTDAQRETYDSLTGDAAIAFVIKTQAFDFDTMPLDNHSPRAYVDAIKEAETTGYDIGVIDSLTHAWAGKNGALEQKDNIAARGGNTWTAWRDITPMHNALVDAMLSSRMHIMATLRQKMEYIQTTGANGKQSIEKVGLAAIQREGMEYEFTIFGDMEQGNAMRISKHRLPGVLSIGDVFEKPGEVFARKVYGWLMSGSVPMAPRPVTSAPDSSPSYGTTQAITDALHAIEVAGTLEELEALIPALKSLTGAAAQERNRRYRERKAWLESEIAKRPTVAAAGAPLGAMVDAGMTALDRMDAADAAFVEYPEIIEIETAQSIEDLKALAARFSARKLGPGAAHDAMSVAYKARLQWIKAPPAATTNEEREYIESLQPEQLARDRARPDGPEAP
jgi:hypothetical protein